MNWAGREIIEWQIHAVSMTLRGHKMPMLGSGRVPRFGYDVDMVIILAGQLFQRCLMKILNIELWRLYLNYVKETKCMLPTYKYVFI